MTCNGTIKFLMVSFFVLLSLQGVSAETKPQEGGHQIKLGEGKVILTAPSAWERKEPKFKGIVTAEFAIKPADGDQAAGRVTLGGLGGGIRLNLQRWISQYSQAETKQEMLEIAGQKVTKLSVRGTYKGSRFRKEPAGPGYRLLGATVQTKDAGSYYIKFYGPEQTVNENEKAFNALLESLQVRP